MAKEEINIVDLLRKKLEEEIAYKNRCDNGEISYYDIDYDANMVLEYSQETSYEKARRWNDIFKAIERYEFFRIS